MNMRQSASIDSFENRYQTAYPFNNQLSKFPRKFGHTQNTMLASRSLGMLVISSFISNNTIMHQCTKVNVGFMSGRSSVLGYQRILKSCKSLPCLDPLPASVSCFSFCASRLPYLGKNNMEQDLKHVFLFIQLNMIFCPHEGSLLKGI